MFVYQWGQPGKVAPYATKLVQASSVNELCFTIISAVVVVPVSSCDFFFGPFCSLPGWLARDLFMIINSPVFISGWLGGFGAVLICGVLMLSRALCIISRVKNDVRRDLLARVSGIFARLRTQCGRASWVPSVYKV